jgi:hypothetical protein
LTGFRKLGVKYKTQKELAAQSAAHTFLVAMAKKKVVGAPPPPQLFLGSDRYTLRKYLLSSPTKSKLWNIQIEKSY